MDRDERCAWPGCRQPGVLIFGTDPLCGRHIEAPTAELHARFPKVAGKGCWCASCRPQKRPLPLPKVTP